MTRTPRAATPVPVDPVPESLREKFERWKAAIAILVVVMGAVGSLFAWVSTRATKDDVERARATALGEFEQVRQQNVELGQRLPVVESATRDLKADTTIIRAQLFEIAKTVGAPQVQPQPALVAPAP